MELSKTEIAKEIKKLEKLKNIFTSQDFLDYIGKRCIKVLEGVTSAKGALTRSSHMNNSFVFGHRYETLIEKDRSVITLKNIATNDEGEYISGYIEYGTGVFAQREMIEGQGIVSKTTRPNGWVYPTDANDYNPKKKFSKKSGTWFAFTWGQSAKYVYTDALDFIEREMQRWIDEYMKEVGL